MRKNQTHAKVENPIATPVEASKAAHTLGSANASGRAKSLAGSVLANARHHQPQVNPVTTPAEASQAAKVLNNPNASTKARSLAGSALVNARHHPKGAS